jgi:hypothetical protein
LCVAYQVDDASGGRFVANEEKALASLRSPGDVALVGGGGLLVLLIAGKGLGLESVGAEEEELFAGDQVPVVERLISAAGTRYVARAILT